MPPKSWKPCPHCGQVFSPSSLPMHEKRCNQREDVLAEHELRELEGFARPPPLKDWKQCPNCGEKYGSTAIGPHVARCRRLRPYGANGFGSGGGPPETPKSETLGAEPFKGLWGIGDVSELIRQLREKAGITKDTPMDEVRQLFNRWDTDGNGKITKEEMAQVLQKLTDFTPEQIDALFDAADMDKDGVLDYEEFLNFLWDPSTKKLSQAELDALRALFDRFDADKDNSLEPAEFMNLMQNMLPTRAGEFDVADIDSDGGIDFDEFVKYWQSVVGKPGFSASELDEVADMFNCFDKNDSGELDQKEFLNLLDNLFPSHCDENRKHVEDEFAACDASNTNGVSFAELLAYYDRLKSWYGDDRNGWPPLDAKEREESLGAEFVTSRCGLKFLPDRLPVHHRSCPTCKKIVEDEQAEEARRRAEEEARMKEALRKAREEEEERRRKAQEEEEARRRAEEQAIQDAKDEEARRRAQEEARMKEALRKAREEKEERLRRAQEEEEARRRAEEQARRKAEEAKKDPNGFIPCRYCGRTFFPDRVPKHEAACPKNKGAIHGIRPTVTPGEVAPTIGRYDIPR